VAPSPTTLSYQQIENLWIQNGGPPSAAPIMAAIAEAESGGNTQSLNNTPSTGDYSVGLWQINYFDGMLAGRTAEYGSPSQLQADPNLQAKAAISLYGGGGGLSNWTTYTSGAYKKYLNGANASAASAINGGGQLGGYSGNPPGQTGCAAGSQGISLSAGPISFGTGIGNACQIKALTGGLLIGLGGAVMIVGGVLIFFGPSRAKAVVKAASPLRFLPSTAKAATGVGETEAPAVETPQTESYSQSDLDDAFGEGVVAGQGSESTARTTRQGQREGERATDRAGRGMRGPGDRRTQRERLREAA
jgi:hypothetical protein